MCLAEVFATGGIRRIEDGLKHYIFIVSRSTG